MAEMFIRSEACFGAKAENKAASKRIRKQLSYQRDKAIVLERTKQWKLKNPEKKAEQGRKADKVFREKYPERAAQLARERRQKIKQDPVQKLASTMRETLKITIRAHLKKRRGGYSEGTLHQRLGCGADELVTHITKQLSPGMTWQNYGVWVVARIVPFAEAQTIQDVERLAHYTNCHPVWIEQHLRKAGGIRRTAHRQMQKPQAQKVSVPL